jgi:putative NADH-flavin reductase
MELALCGVNGRLGSRIAGEDLAMAFLDEVERPHFACQRIAVAYRILHSA